MKLSQLEAMVEAMRGMSRLGTDPEVRFHVRRTGEPIGPREHPEFVQYDIPQDDNLAWDKKVVATSRNIVAKVGDYDLPLEVAPFYKE